MHSSLVEGLWYICMFGYNPVVKTILNTVIVTITFLMPFSLEEFSPDLM